ncbi:MAG: cupin domain-containing protein [Gemmatimonadetes bacterium]|nr:cupin domain-containing protein [Gemmatimonadota bacterium]
MPPVLELHNRHTGETLLMRRVRSGTTTILELEGGVPARGDGPPLHIHTLEREVGTVIRGTLSGIVGTERVTVPTGQTAVFPAGVLHRWWNEGDEPLWFKGTVEPVVDFDRYLQAMVAVVNAGPPDRPPFFYLAHVLYRHRATQRNVAMPAPVAAVLLPLVVLIGTLLGKYRGDDWPGSPASCTGAPEA